MAHPIPTPSPHGLEAAVQSIRSAWGVFWANIQNWEALVVLILTLGGGTLGVFRKKIANWFEARRRRKYERLKQLYEPEYKAEDLAIPSDPSEPYKGPNWIVSGGPDLNQVPRTEGIKDGNVWHFIVPIYIINLSANMGTGFDLEIHVPSPYRISEYRDHYNNFIGTSKRSPLSDRNHAYTMVSFKHPNPATIQIEKIGSVKLTIYPNAELPGVFKFGWRIALGQGRYFPGGNTLFWFNITLVTPREKTDALPDTNAPEAAT